LHFEFRLRESYGATRGAKEMCHSTKRTHRFAWVFITEQALHKELAAEIREKIRWVRFGKRTQIEPFFSGFSSRMGSFRRELARFRLDAYAESLVTAGGCDPRGDHARFSVITWIPMATSIKNTATQTRQS
jgi:hypothetical protein